MVSLVRRRNPLGKNRQRQKHSTAAYSIVHAAAGQVLAAAYGVLEDNPHLIDTLRALQES